MSRIDWLCWGLVMVVAIFFRFHRLADVPPGLVTDAAINGIDGWRLLYRGGHTLFLTNNGGRESTMIYLQALSMQVFGTTPLAVRFPTALVDTLSVAVTFWFAFWFFRDQGSTLARRAALWAGLTMAVSHWLVVVSRMGFRAVLVPLVTVAFFWCYLLARQRRAPGWFILAGVFLGLSAYTYSATRVLPLILGLTVLIGAMTNDERRTTYDVRRMIFYVLRSTFYVLRQNSGFFITLITAALVYLPMLLQTMALTTRPATVGLWNFTETSGQLSLALWQNFITTLGFFCCRGNEKLLLFGLPGRAGLDLISGLFLACGLGVSLWHFRRFEDRLLVIWFLGGLLPGILSIEAPHPLRLIAAAPAMALLVARGIEFGARRWPGLAVIATGWLVVAGALTYLDYFVRWPALSETAGRFGQPMVELAETLTAQVKSGQVIYLPQSLYATPTLRFYLTGSFPPQATDSFQETATAIELRDETAPAWVRLSTDGVLLLPPPQIDRQHLSESSRAVTMEPHRLSWQQPNRSLDYRLGSARLYGAAFPRQIPEAGLLAVTLFWQADQSMSDDYQVILQLLDDAGRVWSLNEGDQPAGGAYPTSYWRPNLDRVADYHELRLKADLPVGRYRLAVALFDPARNLRLPVSPAAGGAPDTVFLGPLKVSPLFDATFKPANDMVAVFEDVADLRGYTVENSQVVADQPLIIDLLWQASTEVNTDYTVFVHLLDAAGNRVAGQDSQPLGGAYPTGLWDPAEQIIDRHAIDTSGVAPGSYHLALGLYDITTGERVPVAANPDRIIILEIPIEILAE